MLCSFPLFVKPQEKKSKNFTPSIGSFGYGLNNRPKPIRTCMSTNQEKFDHKDQYPKDLCINYDFSLAKEKAKHDEDGLKKTKSRALKIYRELKKIKQPISSGGRLSSFLNSLFTNGKKIKISSNSGGYDNEEKKLSKNIISSPCGHKNLDMDQKNVEVEKSINRNYIHENHELKFHKNIEVEDHEDEGASCASSDLFELDIFSSVGLMEFP